jgi:mannonate dehydratase
MNAPIKPTRREMIRGVASGAVLATSTGRLATISATSRAGAEREQGQKSNIRIGTRISPPWLEGGNEHLHFLKQIGVDYVDIELVMVEGYRQSGTFTKAALHELINRFAGAGLKIERANALGPYIENAHLGLPEGQREIDNLKKMGELLAEADVPVYGIQVCQSTQFVSQSRAGWSRRKGRGGYDYPAFDRAMSQSPELSPRRRVTSDQLWSGLLNIFRQVIPVVGGSKTRIAMHGNDPPLYDYLGNPQIICRFADFDRLFAEVPSQHNGITFCVGTRYESGEDIYEGLRHFGRAGKLFHVHFRNVRGTLTTNQSYSEVSVDDGDIDMHRVVQTLHEVGYDGVIDYDHPIGISGDDPLHKQYISFAVGYMRGLLHSLPK